VFVGAMTLVRILGTRVIDRYGRVTVLRVSGLVSLAGLLLFGFAPNLVVAGFGVVAWGLGAALAVPIGLAAASEEPLRAAGRVSVVSAFASLAHLAAPPLLGLAAETIGARHALLLITGAMVLSVLLAGHVARPAAARATVTAEPVTTGDAGVTAGATAAATPTTTPATTPSPGTPGLEAPATPTPATPTPATPAQDAVAAGGHTGRVGAVASAGRPRAPRPRADRLRSRRRGPRPDASRKVSR
jgi:MFS family permease